MLLFQNKLCLFTAAFFLVYSVNLLAQVSVKQANEIAGVEEPGIYKSPGKEQELQQSKFEPELLIISPGKVSFDLSAVKAIEDRNKELKQYDGNREQPDLSKIAGDTKMSYVLGFPSVHVAKEKGFYVLHKNSFAQINYGTGKDVSKETLSDAGNQLVIRWSNTSFLDLGVSESQF